MCRPSGALGWVGHGLSTASPRRPTEAACILYAFFGKAKQCPERWRAHFCARPRPARFWFPYAGMPDLVVRPAKSDLRLKIAYGRSSLRGCGPHDGGRVCACPSAVTLKAAVSRAAESDCQTDRTRRLSAVIRRRDRSGSSRPRSERRAFTVPAAVKTINNGDLDCWTSCPLSGQNERTAHPGGASEGAGLSPDVSSPLIGRPMGRARVPSGFRPRGFSRPAVAGVGRRARRAWKLKMVLPGGLEPPACGLGNRRSVLMSYGSSVPGRRRGSPERNAVQLRARAFGAALRNGTPGTCRLYGTRRVLRRCFLIAVVREFYLTSPRSVRFIR